MLEPICFQCKKNHGLVWKNKIQMWQELIDSTQNNKDKQYYKNCLAISEKVCGPHGSCQYWR